MLKKLARSIREYKKQTLITPLLMIGEVSCECVIPLITKRLIDGIQAGCEMRDIFRYGLMLVAMAFVSLFFGPTPISRCDQLPSVSLLCALSRPEVNVP